MWVRKKRRFSFAMRKTNQFCTCAPRVWLKWFSPHWGKGLRFSSFQQICECIRIILQITFTIFECDAYIVYLWCCIYKRFVIYFQGLAYICIIQSQTLCPLVYSIVCIRHSKAYTYSWWIYTIHMLLKFAYRAPAAIMIDRCGSKPDNREIELLSRSFIHSSTAHIAYIIIAAHRSIVGMLRKDCGHCVVDLNFDFWNIHEDI